MKKRKTNKAKRVDGSCRNHGSCAYCEGCRLYQSIKGLMKAKQQVQSWHIEREKRWKNDESS